MHIQVALHHTLAMLKMPCIKRNMQVSTTAILSPPQDCSACLQNIKHKSLKLLELK